MPKALKVTEESIDYIIRYAKKLQFDLEYIRDSVKDATDFGHELYVITDGTEENNNITFMTMWEDDFQQYWMFKYDELESIFAEIEHL